MNEAIRKKLRVPDNKPILLLNAPYSFLYGKEDLNVHKEAISTYDFVHLFVYNMDDLKTFAPIALQAVNYDQLLWISYPKKSGKIKTDITRDKGWEPLIDHGLEGVTQVSIDDTWSALRFRPRTEIKNRKRKITIGIEKQSTASHQPVQPLETPKELMELLTKNDRANNVFQELAPSYKNAYISWIIEAKRETTRQKRLAQTINKLELGLKGPFEK